MRDNHHVTWAVVAGAAIGGLIGYLFFTDSGRRLRARIEPAIDDLIDQAHGWKGAVEKVTAFAAQSGLLSGAPAAPPEGVAEWDERGQQPH